MEGIKSRIITFWVALAFLLTPVTNIEIATTYTSFLALKVLDTCLYNGFFYGSSSK